MVELNKICYISPNHGLPTKDYDVHEEHVHDTPMLPTCRQIMKTGYNKQGGPIWDILCYNYMTKREPRQFHIPDNFKFAGCHSDGIHNMFIPNDMSTVVDMSNTWYDCVYETEYWMQCPDGFYISLPRHLTTTLLDSRKN